MRLKDLAQINLGPQMRRGIAELNGSGETVGGIIVMRFGENAQQTIDGVKDKLAELKRGLPDGVEIVTVAKSLDPNESLLTTSGANCWKNSALLP